VAVTAGTMRNLEDEERVLVGKRARLQVDVSHYMASDIARREQPNILNFFFFTVVIISTGITCRGRTSPSRWEGPTPSSSVKRKSSYILLHEQQCDRSHITEPSVTRI